MTTMQPNIYLLSMIRNESDIIESFLDQALSLFDNVVIVDVQSTDGTYEILKRYAKSNRNLKIYTIDTQEKYQSAMMNSLARVSFQNGADWIFFLDADEFLNIESREKLNLNLRSASSSVIHLPWINLIPSSYGNFSSFDLNQKYFWTGRVSKYNKVAISSEYYCRHPNFYIHEGNHDVSPSYGLSAEKINYHLSILHIPIRSIERLRYKILSAWQGLIAKKNRLPNEGDHVIQIKEMFDEGVIKEAELNYLSAYYGDFQEVIKPINPSELSWPEMNIYIYANKNDLILEKILRSVKETQALDSKIKWIKLNFGEGDVAMASVKSDSELKIIPHPMFGSGEPYREGFKELEKLNSLLPKDIDEELIAKIIETSFLRVDEMPFSAWSELVPALFALFAFIRPRRYVELGTHYGMSFFAACQASQYLNLNTECVAVDSWIGDEHASFHSTHVFDDFKKVIKNKYPNQFYIKGYFIEARESFEDGSIDLLHIDGYHTYEAVKEDFENWLPKMSADGVMIFHDINVFERGFGVWRFWKKLTKTYPNLSLSHMHGLGIIYVGSNKTSVYTFFESLKSKDGYEVIIQTYLQYLGKLAIEKRALEPQTFNPISNPISNSNSNSNSIANQSILKNKTPKYLSFFKNIRDFIVIKRSQLFDVNFYYQNYPDVKIKKNNAIFHFVRHGVNEKRNPSSSFNTEAYLKLNDDVQYSGMNPFVHYIKYGRIENRKCR